MEMCSPLAFSRKVKKSKVYVSRKLARNRGHLYHGDETYGAARYAPGCLDCFSRSPKLGLMQAFTGKYEKKGRNSGNEDVALVTFKHTYKLYFGCKMQDARSGTGYCY
eukprot:1152849-Pelagomonas_calceolata.AAC.2